MADDVVLNPGNGGDVIAADDIGGIKFQRVKMTLGGDGVNGGDVSSSNPMPVRVIGSQEPTQAAYTAGAPSEAYRVMTTNPSGAAIYCDAATIAHADRAIGISSIGANTGDQILVQNGGLLTNAGWSWTPGQLVFTGLNGVVTSAQVGLFSQAVGYAVTPTSINVRIGRAIVRA